MPFACDLDLYISPKGCCMTHYIMIIHQSRINSIPVSQPQVIDHWISDLFRDISSIGDSNTHKISFNNTNGSFIYRTPDANGRPDEQITGSRKYKYSFPRLLTGDMTGGISRILTYQTAPYLSGDLQSITTGYCKQA